ncbi:hypothetical protein EVAR_51184_1 [Eumeta japonica]|uniref:Uncharacterized protein n=1 Tax=Eumeta variegata TaxID=151549 RepID=A0A4C1XB09_EUMVA|nr:hypothetical protein EVAR_51184_1 [Eumeta japonica]
MRTPVVGRDDRCFHEGPKEAGSWLRFTFPFPKTISAFEQAQYITLISARKALGCLMSVAKPSFHPSTKGKAHGSANVRRLIEKYGRMCAKETKTSWGRTREPRSPGSNGEVCEHGAGGGAGGRGKWKRSGTGNRGLPQRTVTVPAFAENSLLKNRNESLAMATYAQFKHVELYKIGHGKNRRTSGFSLTLIKKLDDQGLSTIPTDTEPTALTAQRSPLVLGEGRGEEGGGVGRETIIGIGNRNTSSRSVTGPADQFFELKTIQWVSYRRKNYVNWGRAPVSLLTLIKHTDISKVVQSTVSGFIHLIAEIFPQTLKSESSCQRWTSSSCNGVGYEAASSPRPAKRQRGGLKFQVLQSETNYDMAMSPTIRTVFGVG